MLLGTEKLDIGLQRCRDFRFPVPIISSASEFSEMGAYNFNLLRDELSLPAWLVVGAAAQIVVSFFAPYRYSLVPVISAFCILAINLGAQYVGIYGNTYLQKATLGRWSVLFPEKDGSRPEKLADKPVAIFLVGIRSNQ